MTTDDRAIPIADSVLDNFDDATALAELIRRGEVSPIELVDATIERIERIDGALNSVIVPLFEKARAEAATVSGPFSGVPYLLKDISMESNGDPYASGIAALKAAGYRSTFDSYLVERMRDAGFVLIGKSNTPEMALYATTEPEAWGPTRNPWDPSRSTGGSSGGAAAAVAAGLVPVAHGSDGGGSIRMPASQCGVVGLKPSRGRISQGPTVPDSDNCSGMAVEGFLTRSVRDTAAMLDVVSGHRPGDAYWAPPPIRPFIEEVGADPGRLRIGVLTEDPTGAVDVDPECAAAARSVADLLASLGHEVSDGYPPALRNGSWPEAFMVCVAVLVARELDRLGEVSGVEIGADGAEAPTWTLAELGRQVTGAQYAAGVDALRLQAATLERWWENDGWDLLLTPTQAATSPKLGTLTPSPDDPMSAFSNALPLNLFTVPFNVSGQPAISLPVAMSSTGLPIGVQLGAAYGREDLLLRVSAQIDAAMPWADRRPPLAFGASAGAA